MISLRKNVIANYISQLYIVFISIITLPHLAKVMGAESYGLIGFYSLLQSWLLLLDLGMSPTLSREVSRFRGGATDANYLMYVFNALKKIFIVLAVFSSIITTLASNYLSTSWLKIEKLDHHTVMLSIILIGLVIAFRWVLGIYKAVVNGFERLIWLGTYNSLFITIRFVFVFLILYLFSPTPIIFFSFQLIISIIELITIIYYTKNLLPQVKNIIPIEFKLIKNTLKFSLTIAFTGAVWIVVTQTDKLILSKLLELSEYGYYTLAIQLAGGITLLAGPISTAILPRLTKMEAEGKFAEVIDLYRLATQMIVIIAGSVSLMLVFFSKDILLAWTGDQTMVVKVQPYLILYAIGNFILSIASFPYYLQYAKGNLKLHLYGNIGFIVLLLPCLILLVQKYGGIGAGYAWIGVNFIFLFFWIPFIHNYLVKGLNKKWFLFDILQTIIPPTLLSYLMFSIHIELHNRFYIVLKLLFAGIIILMACILCGAKIRKLVFKLINRYKF
jgi:O-antigen/teichoic acid export membrane protein